MSYTISLPYPVSANRYWRSFVPKGWGRAVVTLSPEAKAYKEAAGWAAKSAGVRTPMAGYIELAIVLHPKQPKKMKNPDEVRCIDLDNCIKVTLDALNGVAYADDAQVRRIVAERGQPSGDGVLVIKISELLPEVLR